MELFEDTFVPFGLDDVWFATRGCPDCLDRPLQHVQALDASHWLCTTCGECWRVEHGLLRQVDPLTCHGCAARRKSECIAQWALTFPQFGAGPTTDTTTTTTT
jgi:hypothetical protein